MNKTDLADPAKTEVWKKWFEAKGFTVILADAVKGTGVNKVADTARTLMKDKIEREKARGRLFVPVRAMIVGIPNVGKSTFINRLAKRKATVTGNKPGVTKAQQIIKVDKDFELFDTPGVLWPKFENETVARNIALIGSIKQQILPREDLFMYAVEHLVKNYPRSVENRYQIEIDLEEDWIEKCYDDIASNKKIKPVRGITDYERVMDMFFTDLFDGAIAKVTWELPNE